MSGARRPGKSTAGGFSPVRTGDLVSEVSERILQAILDGRLAPGQRLIEANVARQMEVSRAPVREAARRLEQRGLLVSKPRRGFFVRPLSLPELDDLYGLRICLEHYAGRQACSQASDADIARLGQQVDLMQSLADQEGPEFEEADLRFHQMLIAMSGNERLARFFDDLSDELRMVLSLIGRVYEDQHLIAETHRPVVAALAARDPAALDAAIGYHIGEGWRRVRSYFANRQEAKTVMTGGDE